MLQARVSPLAAGGRPALRMTRVKKLQRTAAGVVAWLAFAIAPDMLAAASPTIASINLCADQLALVLADPAQIRSLSWLAADPAESLLAEAAARFPLNHGSAEELLAVGADVVLAGAYTAPHTRSVLRRLGIEVVELSPARSIADVELNVERVARAIGQPERGRRIVAAMRERHRMLDASRPARPVDAIVLRPGSFTVGRDTLAHELMTLAGLRNLAALQELDAWGSMPLETLLVSSPPLLVMNDYRAGDASLAHHTLAHPALRAYAATARVVHIPGPAWACGLPQSLDTAAVLNRAARAVAP